MALSRRGETDREVGPVERRGRVHHIYMVMLI